MATCLKALVVQARGPDLKNSYKKGYESASLCNPTTGGRGVGKSNTVSG